MAAEARALKILLIGPSKVGKTTIANFLSEHTDTLRAKDTYTPTAALRVVEFERDISNDQYSGNHNVAVQLWDVAGDHKYEMCWPAIMKDADGVVMVYNPDNKAHEKEIEIWYEFFAREAGIDDDKCLALAHTPTPGPKPRPPKALQHVRLQGTSFESPGLLRMEFDKYVAAMSNMR